MTPRYWILWAEYKFRQKAIFRLYPDAKIRTGSGNPWDMHGPDVVHVVLDSESSHGVYYDHEMSLLQTQIHIEMRKASSYPDIVGENTKDWPFHDNKVVQMNQMMDLMVSCACDEKTWQRDDVQDIYAKMFNKQPLDRIVEGLNA